MELLGDEVKEDGPVRGGADVLEDPRGGRETVLVARPIDRLPCAWPGPMSWTRKPYRRAFLFKPGINLSDKVHLIRMLQKEDVQDLVRRFWGEGG